MSTHRENLQPILKANNRLHTSECRQVRRARRRRQRRRRSRQRCRRRLCRRCFCRRRRRMCMQEDRHRYRPKHYLANSVRVLVFFAAKKAYRTNSRLLAARGRIVGHRVYEIGAGERLVVAQICPVSVEENESTRLST